jgi:hypothetical protein
MTDAVNILMDQQPGGDAVARQRAASTAFGGGVAAARAAGVPPSVACGSGVATVASAVVRCGDAVPDKESG